MKSWSCGPCDPENSPSRKTAPAAKKRTASTRRDCPGELFEAEPYQRATGLEILHRSTMTHAQLADAVQKAQRRKCRAA